MFTVKYSMDKGKTILESEAFWTGLEAVQFGHKIIRQNGIVYGLFCDGKRI